MNGNAEAIPHASSYVQTSRKSILDFILLMKPELTSLSVLTAICSFYVAHSGEWSVADVWLLLNLSCGTMLLGGGAGALNQYLERHHDAMMRRTEKRPLPSGRLSPYSGLVFGIILASIGLLQLTLCVNVLTGFLAAITLTTYLFLYTPMKRLSPIATAIGGIPGALPPLMGWAAARNQISYEGLILFGILFLWQMPHFFSLAWLYKKDYARAGYRLLTVDDATGKRTSRHILANCAALVPISLIPSVTGMTSLAYFIGALFLGLVFLWFAVMFVLSFFSTAEDASLRPNLFARRLFFASLIYLPGIFTLMVIDKM